MSVQTQKNNYLQQVIAVAKACGVYRKPMAERIRVDLEDYLVDHPEATVESLQQHFGHPEDYVKEFLTGVSSEELARTLSAKRFWRKLAITVAAVFLTSVVALGLWIGIRNSQTVQKYYSFEVYDEGMIPLPERSPYG